MTWILDDVRPLLQLAPLARLIKELEFVTFKKITMDFANHAVEHLLLTPVSMYIAKASLLAKSYMPWQIILRLAIKECVMRAADGHGTFVTWDDWIGSASWRICLTCLCFRTVGMDWPIVR